jgi:molybdopterin/thiamine biosynthesis adenylyltransferase
MRLLSDARNAGTIPAIVHTHPNGLAAFSAQDDSNEAKLARTTFVKGLPGLLSIVINSEGQLAARIWRDGSTVQPIDEIAAIGRRISLQGRQTARPDTDKILDRQARLFGQKFNADVRSLRVGIAGAGATGSATATLLNRLGVGYLFVADKDSLDITNLNRVHGSHRSDVETKLSKVEILKREIETANCGTHYVSKSAWAGDPETWEAFKSCDVIFGCTDDHGGRLFLNRLAHFYGIPLIDMGLRMRRRDHGGVDVFGRVTTIVPGHTCLLCSNIIDPTLAAEDRLKQADPEAYNKLKEEAYLKGGGDPSPAVVTFTTEMATVAVNELIASLTGFHGADGMVASRVRRFHFGDDRFPGRQPKPGCRLCHTGEFSGLGDQSPFLDMVS